MRVNVEHKFLEQNTSLHFIYRLLHGIFLSRCRRRRCRVGGKESTRNYHRRPRGSKLRSSQKTRADTVHASYAGFTVIIHVTDAWQNS
jgi:hypothetical protein